MWMWHKWSGLFEKEKNYKFQVNQTQNKKLRNYRQVHFMNMNVNKVSVVHN